MSMAIKGLSSNANNLRDISNPSMCNREEFIEKTSSLVEIQCNYYKLKYLPKLKLSLKTLALSRIFSTDELAF